MKPTNNQTRINDLLHRLQSMEVDLHEAMRAREIAEADYSERLDRLRNALGHANKIKAMMAPTKIDQNPISQVDLPVMSDYSRMEQKIVSKFVADMKNKVNEVTKVTQRSAEWIQHSAIQSTGWVMSIWRLSWMRRQLLKVENELNHVRKSRDVVEDFIARAEIGKASDSKIISQRDLMSAFSEFEQATERVTALRARVRSESAKNEAMRSWLKSLEIERRSKSPDKPTPELNDVVGVTSEISEKLMGAAKLAENRLVIARQVLKEAKKLLNFDTKSGSSESENLDSAVASQNAVEQRAGKKKTKKRYRGNRL